MAKKDDFKVVQAGAVKSNSPSAIALRVGQYAVLVIACLLVFIPIMVILLGSLKTDDFFSNSGVFQFPDTLKFSNYAEAMSTGNIFTGLKNTAILIVISCAGTIITGSMTAFVVQRFSSVITKVVSAMFMVAMLLPNIAMQVTVFGIISKMNLYNTMWAPIVLWVGTDIISIRIFIQFLDQISVSLDESGIVDGASYPKIYFSIILPNLTPAIATVLIIKFVSIYNDFYTPQLYMPDEKLAVVSTALYKIMNATTIHWPVVFASIIICILPTLIIFLFLQRYIYSGLVSGAVKE